MCEKADDGLSSNFIATSPQMSDDRWDEGSQNSDSMVEGVVSFSDTSETAHTANLGGLELPCAIPQITKSFKGAFYSPFVRAYAPALHAHGITKEDFATFIDGLNECFIAHPVFKGTSIVGQVLTMAYGVHPVQWAGMSLQFASGVVSATTSYARTRAYVKAVNKDLFHRAGLHLYILTTRKMLQKLGHPDDNISLPSLNGDEVNDTETEQPLMWRIKAMEGYATPLDFDIPDGVQPDGLFRKLGASQALKSSRKQNARLLKRREKINKKKLRIDRTQSKGEARTDRLEQTQLLNARELNSRLKLTSSAREVANIQQDYEHSNDRLQGKIQRRSDKTARKIDRKSRKYEQMCGKVDKKEGKTANGVRWIVVVAWSGEVNDSDVDSWPSSD